ncbi:MAG: cytochrome oxidase putative small subunit CydP [Pseudomonadota bacterium]|jgi:hypothetical protein
MKPPEGVRSVLAAAQRAGVAALRQVVEVDRRSALAREITLALLFKAIALMGLWALFFRSHPAAQEPPRPAILLGSSPLSSPNQEALKP